MSQAAEIPAQEEIEAGASFIAAFSLSAFDFHVFLFFFSFFILSLIDRQTE